MPSGILRSGAAPAPTHLLLIAVVLVGTAFALSQGITTVSLRHALVVVSALVLFGVAFAPTILSQRRRATVSCVASYIITCPAWCADGFRSRGSGATAPASRSSPGRTSSCRS